MEGKINPSTLLLEREMYNQSRLKASRYNILNRYVQGKIFEGLEILKL